jgi:hypothetical protein
MAAPTRVRTPQVQSIQHVRILGLIILFVALIAAVPIQSSQTSDAYVRTWLHETMGFSAGDVRDVI